MTATNDKIKRVEWTIKNAHIVPGKGEKATDKQPIFTITGEIHRSDSTDKEPQEGTKYEWTPEKKAKGFTLDTSKFNLPKDKDDPSKGNTGTGTIVVKGWIVKGGRPEKEIATGDTLTNLLNLA
jgi:hypothetical protein